MFPAQHEKGMTDSIKDSSEPFQAFFGVILSVVKDVPVERTSSSYSSDMELDIIKEEDDALLPEDDIDDDLTDFLQKTELLDSPADKSSQCDIRTTIEHDDMGFNNATFSWSVELSDRDGTSTPYQRTFQLHISGEQLTIFQR